MLNKNNSTNQSKFFYGLLFETQWYQVRIKSNEKLHASHEHFNLPFTYRPSSSKNLN